ncbi:MAG: fatty acid desaturase [Gammaproteobacteria bacterium]|jgi:stearoyl-CoA desaturase (delta-9 desaturase)|nr:fatty acid desaturase [Gammaproteobacteria bacterium]
MFYGLCNLPWWGDILVLLGLTQVTIAAVTIYLHRHSAHRALTMNPVLSHFFRMWLWLTTGMGTKAWTAIHRKHHAKCETPEDPHSPQIMGLSMVLWKGAELYRLEAVNQETMERYGQGTPDDWLENHLYKHGKLGIFIMMGIDLLLFGAPGLTIWALQMAWIPFFAAGVVNGIGHYWGYRNFECPDQARNICPLGIFIGGEELHNNHHTYPTSAKLSVKWWEFDMGWLYIRLFEILGLAKAKRRPPEPKLIPGKTQVDMETLKAIISNRFQVMARYTNEVLVPVFKQKMHGDDNGVKTLLVRETSLLDTSAKQRLAAFLAENKTIQQAYQFKERLQSLWTQTSLKESDLLEALQGWCQEAETTGIVGLKEFSAYLKSFTPAPMPA